MGNIHDFNRSMHQLNAAKSQINANRAKIRLQIIQKMVYALRTDQPMPAPFPTKEEVKATKGFMNRMKMTDIRKSARHNQDLQRVYDDYNAGTLTPENALSYLESQLAAL